jgi:hypothetical protein
MIHSLRHYLRYADTVQCLLKIVKSSWTAEANNVRRQEELTCDTLAPLFSLFRLFVFPLASLQGNCLVTQTQTQTNSQPAQYSTAQHSTLQTPVG